MIAFIAARDRLSVERAKAVFATLSVADLIGLELQVCARCPAFQSDYDPFARGD